MAQKVVTSLVDDLDESPADETVEFAIGKANYEIDLNAKHATELRDALAKYVAAARRLSGRRATGRRQTTTVGYTAPPTESGRRPVPSNLSGKREQNQSVREWARKQGAVVGDKGRIPEPITLAFHAGDAAAIPSRYLDDGAKAKRVTAPVRPEQATLEISEGDDVTTGDDAPSSDGPTSTETAEQAPSMEMNPALMPASPTQMSPAQKKVIAEWGVEQGIIDTPALRKVNKDLVAQYKVVMARSA